MLSRPAPATRANLIRVVGGVATLDWDPVGDELVAVVGEAEHTEVVQLAEGLALVLDERAHGRCVMVLATDASLMRGRRSRLLASVLGPTLYEHWVSYRSDQRVVVRQQIPIDGQELQLMGAVWRSVHPVDTARRAGYRTSPGLLRLIRHWITTTPGWAWPVLYQGKESDQVASVPLGDIAPVVGLGRQCELERSDDRTIRLRIALTAGRPVQPVRLDIVVGRAQGSVRLRGSVDTKVRLDARAASVGRVLLELRGA